MPSWDVNEVSLYRKLYWVYQRTRIRNVPRPSWGSKLKAVKDTVACQSFINSAGHEGANMMFTMTKEFGGDLRGFG
jgi:hypothetical protein